MKMNPKQRFSPRVEYYVKARPKYPPALLDFLRADLGLKPDHRIADIGSGTGFLSELFLANGNPVIGVEPNAEMRAAGEALLAWYPDFRSANGSAEATTLEDHSVDFVVAGQAFHWFDPVKARVEFQRILAAPGWIVLVWNERVKNGSGFDAAYDGIVKWFAVGTEVDFHSTVTLDSDRVLGPFFGQGHFRVREFPNFQNLSMDDFRARLLSSSYMPLPDHPSFDAMMAQAERAFEAHAIRGVVRLSYDTRVYFGKMSE